ncbi:hypothetical protein EG68_00985 [Paragonimus skrjabini miyazakii]|uniref:Large ribosomal subunit protein mL40 n=1 Tax=Paragonimus skrjabini miyazakii TaxID=59628 RepID=A0A8S9Z3J8_9TREM|nr:hypothetical protein EG68_00985 [Paragonimus skrjabini miyazakii]
MLGQLIKPLLQQPSVWVIPSSMLHCSAVLFGEPLKKKKRIDPLIEQNRLRRKVRKIEKEIKRFTRQDRQLKPIAEIEGDRQLYKQLDVRRRPFVDVNENEVDRRAVLMKDWARYQSQVAQTEYRMFTTVIRVQRRALDWLYVTSPELYKAAIQPCCTVNATSDDSHMIPTLPLSISGPYHSAPMVHGDVLDCPEVYDPPDGEAVDTTPVFQYEFELDRQFLADPKKKKLELRKTGNNVSTE